MNGYALCDHSYRQKFSEADRPALIFLGAVTRIDEATFHDSPFICRILHESQQRITLNYMVAMNFPRPSNTVHSRPKVFGVGFTKTGTSSLALALEQAGFRIHDPRAAAHFVKNWARRDFQPIIDFCETADAFEDVPFSLPFTYQALDFAYPGSKFILTTRTSADEWYESLTRFHTDLIGKGRLPTALDLQTFPFLYEGYTWDVQSLVFGVEEHSPYDVDRLKDCYNNHNRQVREYFNHQGDKLLVLNNAEASARDKLCEFLEIENKWGPEMPNIDSKAISHEIKMHLGQQHPGFVTEDYKHAQIDLENAVAVVQSYSKLLKTEKGAGGREILDSGKLSHPKPVIKQSLLTLLKISVDPTEKKVWSDAFVLLADFQPGDVETTGGTADASGKDIVDLERRSLIEELEQVLPS